jgi:hypothetical protein
MWWNSELVGLGLERGPATLRADFLLHGRRARNRRLCGAAGGDAGRKPAGAVTDAIAAPVVLHRAPFQPSAGQCVRTPRRGMVS